MTEQRACSWVTMPALEMEMLCCSIACVLQVYSESLHNKNLLCFGFMTCAGTLQLAVSVEAALHSTMAVDAITLQMPCYVVAQGRVSAGLCLVQANALMC